MICFEISYWTKQLKQKVMTIYWLSSRNGGQSTHSQAYMMYAWDVYTQKQVYKPVNIYLSYIPTYMHIQRRIHIHIFSFIARRQLRQSLYTHSDKQGHIERDRYSMGQSYPMLWGLLSEFRNQVTWYRTGLSHTMFRKGAHKHKEIPGMPPDTRQDKQGSTGRCPGLLLFTIEKLTEKCIIAWDRPVPYYVASFQNSFGGNENVSWLIITQDVISNSRWQNSQKFEVRTMSVNFASWALQHLFLSSERSMNLSFIATSRIPKRGHIIRDRPFPCYVTLFVCLCVCTHASM